MTAMHAVFVFRQRDIAGVHCGLEQLACLCDLPVTAFCSVDSHNNERSFVGGPCVNATAMILRSLAHAAYQGEGPMMNPSS